MLQIQQRDPPGLRARRQRINPRGQREVRKSRARTRRGDIDGVQRAQENASRTALCTAVSLVAPEHNKCLGSETCQSADVWQRPWPQAEEAEEPDVRSLEALLSVVQARTQALGRPEGKRLSTFFSLATCVHNMKYLYQSTFLISGQDPHIVFGVLEFLVEVAHLLPQQSKASMTKLNDRTEREREVLGAFGRKC